MNLGLALIGLAAAIAPALAEEPAAAKSSPVVVEQSSLAARVFQEILPLAWQKRPLMHFNAITEMTAEGRKWTPPTSERPIYYVSSDAKFAQTGWLVAAGERPPPAAEMESAMKAALATNGYLPVAQPEQRPDVLILLSYGSSGTDPASTETDENATEAISASELVPLVLRDPSLFKDVIDRAALIGGDKFASGLKAALDEEVRNTRTNNTLAKAGSPIHLPVSPEFGSPYEVFVGGKNSALLAHLAEVAFHTCYFVIASAYDFTGVEHRQKILLWRTKMTVEAQGVSMEEVLRPLIANAAPYLGREMSEAAIIKKRIDREGHVEMGTPTVVQDFVPLTDPSRPAPPPPDTAKKAP